MAESQPIACSLSKEELPKRLADAAALATSSLLDVETQGARARLRFRPGRDTRAGIDAFIAAESECCPFFEFGVNEQDEDVVLSIKAPADGTWALRGVVAGFVAGWGLPA